LDRFVQSWSPQQGFELGLSSVNIHDAPYHVQRYLTVGCLM
jgi:hypothetical protein